MDKMKLQPPDLVAENVKKIAELFPNCVTETKGADGKPRQAINFDMLRQMLSDDVVEGDEAYEFTWVGKKAAIVEAHRPIRKTLRPCPEESKDWDTTQNLYIEGDNLEVLKLLQESYLGKVKMIYIDPPYNTGNDFIYRDNFTMARKEWSVESGEWSEDGERLFRNTETNGRFHSDWCSMIYSRLLLSRNLLTDNGAIFISIDDNEIDNIIKICNEIFGENNFVDIFSWTKTETPANLAKMTKKSVEYIICYQKSSSLTSLVGLKKQSKSSNGLMNQSNSIKILVFPENIVDTSIKDGLIVKGEYGTDNYKINLLEDTEVKNGIFIKPIKLQGKFKWSQGKLISEINSGTKISIKTMAMSPSYEREEYAPESPWNIISAKFGVGTNENATVELRELMGGKLFDYAKPISLLKYIINFLVKDRDITLDFFSGSATTAHAVMQLNAEDGGHRQFIMVQLQEPCSQDSEAAKAGFKNICEIGKERIRRAGEKIKREATGAETGSTGQLTLAEAKSTPQTSPSTFDIGFRVFKVADSNMKDVYYAPVDLEQEYLPNLISNIKEDRTDLDLLFGCLLDWGLPLSLPYSSEKIGPCTVHTYNQGDLIACFDANIPESVIREIAKRKPLRAVFRDAGFADSPAKINVFEIFKHYMPESADDIRKRVKVI